MLHRGARVYLYLLHVRHSLTLIAEAMSGLVAVRDGFPLEYRATAAPLSPPATTRHEESAESSCSVCASGGSR